MPGLVRSTKDCWQSVVGIDHATASAAGRACRAFHDASQYGRRHDHHAIDQLDLALHPPCSLQRRDLRCVMREASTIQLQKDSMGLKLNSIANALTNYL